MRYNALQDRIARGLGKAARHLGQPYDAYRPVSAWHPLAPTNRFLQLSAVFAEEDQAFRRPRSYGKAAWSGIFDTAYTLPGDYLCGQAGTFFIAAQQPLLPALCIAASRTVTLTRPAAPTAAGVNPYGGALPTTLTTTLAAWPASILFAGAGAPGELPGDASIPTWTILLPPTPVPILTADLVSDDLGKAYVIGSAELTGLGWRILAKQASN